VPLTVPAKVTAVVTEPLHTAWLAGVVTVGVGLTVTVNVWAVPVQPAAKGVTVIKAFTGAEPWLVAVKAAMLPVPEDASPMEGTVFVQLNVLPLTAPVKVTAAVATPLHNTWLAGVTTVGVGLTAIRKLCAVPPQPKALGVTVTVAVCIDVPELVAVNGAMLPVPLAARPMLVLLFAHANVLPLTAPVNATAVVKEPLQASWLGGVTTVGVGSTVMPKDCGVPLQPLAEGVTVMVPLAGVVPPLVPLKAAMLPVPVAPRPMPGLVFTHE
jgi:hypothetical protein